MNKKIRKFKKNWVRDLSPNFTFNVPPYDMYSAFQTCCYSIIYHNNVKATMKNSYCWIQSAFERNKISKKEEPKDILVFLPPIKTFMKNGILRVEIGVLYEEPIEELTTITPTIEKGMLRVEIGNEQNKKVVCIDFKGLELAKVDKVQT